MPRKLSQILVYEADAPDGSAAVSVGGSNDLWAAGVLESAPKFTYDVDRPFKVSLRVKAGSDWGIRGPIDKRLVLHFVYDDGSRKGARIIRIEKRDANEIMDVEAMELLRDLTFSQMYRTLQPSENTSTSVFLSRYTTEEVLAEILSSTWNAPSHFQVGTIASKYASETPQVAGEGLTHWEAIELLRSELGCEVTMTWNAADSKWDVNIVEEIGGGTASDRPIHAPTGGTASSRANRIQLDVLTEDTDYFSRIIATAGEPPIGIQYATFEVDSHTDIAGARRLFLRGNPILIPDQMVGMYAHESLGNDLQISGSGPASGATLCFIDVDGTTIQTGDVIRFQIAPDILSPYVIDPVREVAGGEKVKLLHFENVVPYNNQFERYLGGASDMSSGTTDGAANWIPDGMELVGGATSEEETQAQYVQHGISSVKVTCPAVGDGIQTQTMPWIFREELQANAVWVRVIVLSGKVRLTTRLDGDSAGGNGLAIFPDGEEQIEFKELSPGEAGIVFDLGDDVSQPVDINHRLLALEAGTVFILDALTITISRQLQPYRADMGRSALFREATRYISSHGSGDPVYSVNCIDPAHLDAAHEEIEIGTYVELKGQFDVAGGTFNLDTTGRVRKLVEVDDPSTGRIHKQIEVAKKSPDFANRFQGTKQVPKTEEQPPTIRPTEKVVDLISDLGNQPGAAPQPRVFAARRAITGGPVVNAIYISDPDDTSSVADGVLIIAGSDGVRWKLSGQADARHFGAAADGTTDDRAALAAMDAAAGHNILSRGTYKVDSDITFSSYTILEPGAIIKPANGVTVTLSSFEGDLSQHFDLNLGGSVVIQKTPNGIYPQWFDGTVSADSINAAVAASESGSIIPVTRGENTFTSQILLDKRVTLVGEGVSFISASANRAASTLIKDGSFDGIKITASGAAIRNLQVDGASGNTGDGIVVAAQLVGLESVVVTNQGRDGIRVGDSIGTRSIYNHFERIVTLGNGQHGVHIHDGGAAGAGGSEVTATSILNLRSNGNTGDGLKLDHTKHNTVIHAICEANGAYGINVDDAEQNTFINPYGENNTTDQVFFSVNSNHNYVFGARGTTADTYITDNSTTNYITERVGTNIYFRNPVQFEQFEAFKEGEIGRLKLRHSGTNGLWNLTARGTGGALNAGLVIEDEEGNPFFVQIGAHLDVQDYVAMYEGRYFDAAEIGKMYFEHSGTNGLWHIRQHGNGGALFGGVRFYNSDGDPFQFAVEGDFAHSAGKFGAFGATPGDQPELTYSRTGETTAEAQIRQALSALGLVADNTTA